MRGRKRHLKKIAKKLKVQATRKSSHTRSKDKKSVKTSPSSSVRNGTNRSVTKFACYGKSKICHIVTVDEQGVITALCGDVWTPGDAKAAPQLLDTITEDRRLCKNCEKKQ